MDCKDLKLAEKYFDEEIGVDCVTKDNKLFISINGFIVEISSDEIEYRAQLQKEIEDENSN